MHVFEELLDLTVEQLGEIIENDELNVKQENVVFETILQWVRHAPQNRNAHMGVLLPKVCMELLTHNYFMEHVRSNAFVTHNAAWKPIITRVLKNIYGLNLNESLSSDFTQPRLPNAVLLAIGGWSHDSPNYAIVTYDMQADLWVSVMCPDESPRAYHGMVYLNDFVYCIRGFGGDNYLNSVRRFEPITRTWA